MKALLLLLAALAPAAGAVAAPRFDAIAFFTGRTEGVGRIKVGLGHTRTVHVHGRGHLLPDGTLVLDQTVERPGQPAQQRQWRLRRAGPDRYTGTLSDARGPVAGETIGARLHLSFRDKSGVPIQQWLTLAPDGRSARNILTARKLGIVVARLDETITRIE